MLDFGRKQVLRPQVLNLNAVVGDMASPLARMIGENIRLLIVPGPDVGNVQADPVRVEQAIMNLVVNARDAIPKGGQLTIETAGVTLAENRVGKEPGVAPGPYVVLRVIDAGSSMDAETQRDIFEPFFTTKPRGEGTWLSLSMVYGSVRQSGSHIEVRSAPGEGTTFSIWLPRVSDAAETADAGGFTTPFHKGTETILVVEDEEAGRRILVRALRECGYSVLETSSAREAFPIVEHYEGAIDLLITDVVMPETSGTEVARRLAKARPDMRVLYIADYAESATLQHGLEAGRRTLLIKPFTPSALTKTVRHLLDASRRGPAGP